MTDDINELPAISPEFLKLARDVTKRYDTLWGVRNRHHAIQKIVEELDEAKVSKNDTDTLNQLADVLVVTLAAMHALGTSDDEINKLLGKTIEKAEKRITEKETMEKDKQLLRLTEHVLWETKGDEYFELTSTFHKRLSELTQIENDLTGRHDSIPKKITILKHQIDRLNDEFLGRGIVVTINKIHSNSTSTRQSDHIVIKRLNDEHLPQPNTVVSTTR